MGDRGVNSEAELQAALDAVLSEAFGVPNVEREVRLPSGRVCDFVVTLPPLDVRLAIEVEHNADPGEVAGDVIHGAGQALLYAAELENAVPVVVVNPSEGDQEELAAVRERIPVVEWSQSEESA